MNNEIREILEDMIDKDDFEKYEIYGKRLIEIGKLLLDYITNLQKENDYYFKKNNELSTLNTSLRNARDDYKSRVEKAVVYIKTKGLKEEEWQNGFCEKATATYTREEIFDLLNILQGENNE